MGLVWFLRSKLWLILLSVVDWWFRVFILVLTLIACYDCWFVWFVCLRCECFCVSDVYLIDLWFILTPLVFG